MKKDKYTLIRIAIALQGYFLEEYKEDENQDVRFAARIKLKELEENK